MKNGVLFGRPGRAIASSASAPIVIAMTSEEKIGLGEMRFG